MTQFLTNQVRPTSAWSIVVGLLLAVFGMLAIGSPFLAAIAVTGFLAWLIVFAGVVHLILAFHDSQIFLPPAAVPSCACPRCALAGRR